VLESPPPRPAAAALIRRITRRPLTARRAGRTIALTTVLVALAGAFAITLVDRDEFPTLGSGLWWSAQTVTTVGYGDHVPTTTAGQLVAVAVMVMGIAFISVVTAAISAVFIEGARRRFTAADDDARVRELAELGRRLERIEVLMERLAAARDDDR
jgi:voltage-gated potassium channel Kch